MRAIIWAAVSSKEQSEELGKVSIPDQIDKARAAIENTQGWHEVADPLVIDGHSRNYIFLADAAQDVPQYAQLMSKARNGEIDVVVCRGRDRLGRTTSLVAQVEAYLAHHGCQVFSLDMPARIQEPEDFKFRRERGSIWTSAIERARAEDEIATLTIRHRMGMTRRIKDGLHPSTPPFGYRRNDEGVGEIYEPEAQLVRLVFSWYLDGLTLREIHQRLPQYATGRVPALSMLPFVITNPYYKGKVSWGRRARPDGCATADGLHEAIIDEATWEAAQRERLGRYGHGRGSVQSVNPLSGFVYCGLCGKTMKVDRGASRPGQKYTCWRGCRNGVIRRDLEEVVAAWILEVASDSDALEEELAQSIQGQESQARREVETLQAAIEGKRRTLERWLGDYEAELISRNEYYTHRFRLEEQIGEAENRLDELRTQTTAEPEEITDLLGSLVEADLITEWQDPEAAKRCKAVFRQIGLRIEIKGDEVTLTVGN
jgi:DNA invertase Pin-like site-specific DNA recombinase